MCTVPVNGSSNKDHWPLLQHGRFSDAHPRSSRLVPWYPIPAKPPAGQEIPRLGRSVPQDELREPLINHRVFQSFLTYGMPAVTRFDWR